MNHEARRIAARSDILRVARETGMPHGYAPSETVYAQMGKLPVSRIIKIAGARTWATAVQRLGVRPAGDLRFGATPEAVGSDLRRVALACGHPRVMPSQREYTKHGRWSVPTVYAVLGEGVSSWRTIARSVGLTAKNRTYRKDETREAVAARVREYALARGCSPGGLGPRVRDLIDDGVVSNSVIWGLFGNSKSLIREAGFVPQRPGCRRGWKQRRKGEERPGTVPGRAA